MLFWEFDNCVILNQFQKNHSVGRWWENRFCFLFHGFLLITNSYKFVRLHEFCCNLRFFSFRKQKNKNLQNGIFFIFLLKNHNSQVYESYGIGSKAYFSFLTRKILKYGNVLTQITENGDKEQLYKLKSILR